MDITYPLLALPETETTSSTLPSALYTNSEHGGIGGFGVGANQFWHGGVHLQARGLPVRAIADGHVIAYRMNDVLLEADTGDGGPPHKYSSGFVLIKHQLVTPKGGEYSFFSLYMHLKPMTAEETQQESDSAQAPHIFKKTHYVVTDSPNGSGLPVFDAQPANIKGVIPFGARFTVHPDDDKCRNDRYRKIKLVTARESGYVVLDESKLTVPLPLIRGSKGRVLSEPSVPILDAQLNAKGKTLPRNAFFIQEKAPAPISKLSYTKVVRLNDDPTTGFIENFTLCTEKVSGNYYRLKNDQSLWSSTAATVLDTLKLNTYLVKDSGRTPSDHWTRTAPHNTKNLTLVRVFVTAVTGFALIEASRSASVRKTGRSQSLDIVDVSGAALTSIAGETEYLSLAERPPADSVLTPLGVCKISYPDPTAAGRSEGYAFLRVGYDFMKLEQNAAYPGALYLWGEAAMTALWNNEFLDDTGNPCKEGSLKVVLAENQVFELLDDASVPAAHWSRQEGWRKVSFTYPARQGQAAHSIEGYAYTGAHTTEVTTSGTAAAPPRDKTYTLVDLYESGATKIKHHPPENAVTHYQPSGKITVNLRYEKVAQLNHSYSWEGHFGGVNIRATEDSDSTVQGVLELGSTVKLKSDLAFTSQVQDGKHVWVPARRKMCELTDGGFVHVDGRNISKRSELPKPIEFNKVVTLSNPIPINRGDIVGFPGRTDGGEDQFHFELFAEHRSFAGNAAADKWGPSWVLVDPGARFFTRRVKPTTATDTLVLTGPSLVRVVAKDFSQRGEPGGSVQFKIKRSPLGWISAADIDLDERSGSGRLKAAITQLYKKTKTAEKTVRTTTRDARGVEKVVDEKIVFQQVDTTGGSHTVAGRISQTLKVFQVSGEAVQVDFEEETSGWLSKVDFEAKAKNQGWDPEKVYRYELADSVTLFKENPAGAYEMIDPTDVERDRWRSRLTALPRRRWLDKDWLQAERGNVEEWKDSSGKTWVGVKLETSQTLWFESVHSQHLSSAYDWLDWQFFAEEARPDDPATRGVAENTFDRDGFCDISSLLAVTGSVTPAESLPKLRRFGFLHPTEWLHQQDTTFNKWERLKHEPWNYDDESFSHLMDYIKKLQWWKDVPGLPSADKVWHVHPIGFIEHLRGMVRLSLEQLIKIFGRSNAALMARCIEPLCTTLDRYQITTPLRIAHFLAQTGAETGAFSLIKEEGNPDYEKRPDLGNIYPGDGRNFIGRGFLQITGRFNYQSYEDYAREDLTSTYEQADKLATPRLAFDSAGWYWQKHNLNRIADNPSGLPDADVVKKVSAVINGGCNGLGKRLHYFKKAKYVLCRDIDS